MRLSLLGSFLIAVAAFGNSFGSGAAACTGSPNVFFGFTWDECGNITGNANLLTADSTTGTVNIGPLSTFTGGVFLTSFNGQSGTDGSAASTTFNLAVPSVLAYSVNTVANAPYYALFYVDNVLQFSVVGSLGAPTASGNINLGVGQHTAILGIANTNTCSIEEVITSVVCDPQANITVFSLTPITSGAPEPATLALTLPALAGLYWFSRRKRA